ncbi:PH domain-like protein [Lophium mytilinum]|uniref:PH domain-like protein n=1 Tax=Lophium mytilinum TaxID=390894 RepID=A0A6A6QI24_9PEZI|nr:PH domain-like protein [Lophium mytilinum]
MSCPELDTVSTDSNGRSVEGTSYVTKWGGYRSGDPPITDGLTEAAHPNFSPSLSPSSSKSARLGNENEGFTKLCKFSAKLFIFRRTDHTWGFHGAGEVVLVKYKSNGVTRLMMRKDKSLKLIMDHRVDPSTKISLNTTSDRSWVFNAKDDVAEGTPRDLTLALRFENSEKAELFKKAFVKAQESNAEVLVPGGGVGG